MASFTTSLSDSIRFLTPATKWGSGPPAMTWGTDKWGNGIGAGSFEIATRAMSFNQDSETLSDTFIAAPRAFFDAGSMSFSHGSDQSEILRDSSGLYIIELPGGATNDENAVIASYTTASNPSNTWSLSTTSSPTWSEQ